MIVTDWGPSRSESSTAAMANCADAWPAGMTTEAGTVASVVSLLRKVIVRDSEVLIFTRVTVPVVAEGPADSLNAPAPMASWSVGTRTAGIVRPSSNSSPRPPGSACRLRREEGRRLVPGMVGPRRGTVIVSRMNEAARVGWKSSAG